MRVVFFSDTHLGLDLPARPRVVRRRRGPDFFDNLERVLAYATDTRADLVLHGGDLFFRSRVPPFIVDRVYQRLARFADGGIPIGLIAGNHERSVLPPSLLLAHPRIHVFHAANTHVFELGGGRIAVTGLPFVGDGARFLAQLDAAWPTVRGPVDASVDAHVVLAHEAFDGATVGPADFTFRADRRSDVVPLPPLAEAKFARLDAVLSGHIHRRQVLWQQRADGSRVPVVYAGSIERTSFAEAGEQKGFCVLELGASAGARGRIRFVPLPARPMVDVDASAHPPEAVVTHVIERLARAPRDAIVRVTCSEAQAAELSRAQVAARAHESVTFEVRVHRDERDGYAS